jgi:hypothetical protein
LNGYGDEIFFQALLIKTKTGKFLFLKVDIAYVDADSNDDRLSSECPLVSMESAGFWPPPNFDVVTADIAVCLIDVAVEELPSLLNAPIKKRTRLNCTETKSTNFWYPNPHDQSLCLL